MVLLGYIYDIEEATGITIYALITETYHYHTPVHTYMYYNLSVHEIIQHVP